MSGDAQVCNECEQLFLEPEHLQVLCSDFSLHNVERHTLSYRRKTRALKSNSIRGCGLCRILVNYFKLDTDFWKGVNLGLSDKSPEEVVFALYLVDIAPLVLSVNLEGVKEIRGDKDWLAFELLTTPGISNVNLHLRVAELFQMILRRSIFLVGLRTMMSAVAKALSS